MVTTTMRRRWVLPAAAVLTALGGTGAMAGTASAANPAFAFVPEEVHVRALDANGDEVTQAGAHPDRLQIQFGTTTRTIGTGPRATVLPEEQVKDLEITLPEGIQGNPKAAASCSLSLVGTGQENLCPPDSQVGEHTLRYVTGRGGPGTEISKLYNVEPPEGTVARFAMRVLGIVTVTLDIRVASDGSYRIVTNARNIGTAIQLIGSTTDIWGVPAAKTGLGKQVPLLTLGSQCGVGFAGKIRLNSWRHQEQWLEARPLMPALTGCDRLQFKPTLDLRPTSSVADAPSGYRFELDVPQNENAATPATPPLKRAEILFPEGVAISPGGANGLAGCSDGEAALGVDAAPNCPSAARIGSVKIDTPVLDVPLEGGVFLGAPKSQDAQTGEMFRILLLASAQGVDIKQEGKIFPDPVTGRLRAVFDNAPQQQFSKLTVNMDGGPGAPLVNPPSCGTFTTNATMTSWGGQTATSNSSFAIDCRPGLGAFAPSFLGGVRSPQAGASSPFALSIGKPDGQSALNGVSMQFPAGLLANLKGNVGTQVGTVNALAGSGAAPYALPGKVFLEGAYGDAPFSLKVVVPAKAGPFDLGEVVVKQKIYVDRTDAHVTIVSDPLPTILQGVPIRLQRLDVSVDKPGFMRSPTNCEEQRLVATLGSVSGASVPVGNRFQVGGCGSLPLTPSLALRMTDKAQVNKGKHPGFEATVRQAPGQSGLRKVKVALPLSLALDPDNAKALCEPAAAAARTCPKESIVGSAKAVTPILDQPLEGPVYFVKGTRTTAAGKVVPTLPKLLLTLRGQVALDLMADSDVDEQDRLVTTFPFVPDAPIESFDLKIDGGKNGILTSTGTLAKSVCSTLQVANAEFDGQNGKQFDKAFQVGTPCSLHLLSKTVKKGRLHVKAAGLGAGRLSISGPGVAKASRNIGISSIATISPKLSKAGRAAYARGRAVRATVTFDPAGPAKAISKSAATTKPKAKAKKDTGRAVKRAGFAAGLPTR